uniref:ENTH domain-containing protein n=1 Tax=Aegilops tauschii subsp. strangulata TaxID=200361 RepID=A0A453NKB7_AEGTS
PTFKEEFLAHSHKRNLLHMARFKDDSSPLAWDCSAWVRTYTLFLEERLECFRNLKYDIETERLMRSPQHSAKVGTMSSQQSWRRNFVYLPCADGKAVILRNAGTQ